PMPRRSEQVVPLVIHTLTAIYLKKDQIVRSRLWGWYRSFEEAERAVLKNDGDLFENGYYNHAVIETVPEGMCPEVRRTAWYRARREVSAEDPHVTPVPTPPAVARVVNFAIG